MTPVRVGILGCGRVCRYSIIDPARAGANIEVIAVASRDINKAKAFAADNAIPSAYGSYTELLANREMQAVYVALPNGLHFPWTMAALRAGFPVLCEKPIANNATQAFEMMKLADELGLALMEAGHWYFHPLADRISELLQNQVLGRLKSIDVIFRARRGLVGRDDPRYNFVLGGGALMDLGFYPLTFFRFVTASEPSEIISVKTSVCDGQIDTDIRACLRYPCGLIATLRCSMEADDIDMFEQWAVIEGSKGRMRIEMPFTPSIGGMIKLFRCDSVSIERFGAPSSWYHQANDFAARVDGRCPKISERPVENMKLIDSIYEHANLCARP